MARRLLALAAIVSLLPACAPRHEPARDPNVLLVIADQMRGSAMGVAGNAVVRTPNLDRLAAEGVHFTNAVTNDPVCSPARAALLTGRYPHHTGVTENDIRLPDGEVTIAEILGGRGYDTGYIGKWHLNGTRKEPKDTPEGQGYVPPGPGRQGFTYWAANEIRHNYMMSWYFGDDPTPIPIEGYEPDVQTDLAIAFMEQHRERPFLLVVSWGPPHHPYLPPPEWDVYALGDVRLRPNVPIEAAPWSRRVIARYYGQVSSLDHDVGRLTEALERLGLRDDTIIVFTSDHGDMLGSHGWTYKEKPWRESIHVPLLLRAPGRVAASQTVDAPVSLVDVMPTLLDLTGTPAPAGLDGADLAPLLRGETNEGPEAAYIASFGLDRRGPGTEWRAVMTRRHLFAVSSKGDWLLYDHDRDPYERTNLVGDPESAEILGELRDRLATWRREQGDDAVLIGEPRDGPLVPIGDYPR